MKCNNINKRRCISDTISYWNIGKISVAEMRSRIKNKKITVFLYVGAALKTIADAIKGFAGRSNDGSQGVNCFPKGSHFWPPPSSSSSFIPLLFFWSVGLCSQGVLRFGLARETIGGTEKWSLTQSNGRAEWRRANLALSSIFSFEGIFSNFKIIFQVSKYFNSFKLTSFFHSKTKNQ